MRERIRYYDERVEECVERLRDELDAGSLDDAIWRSAKLLYIGLLVDHKRPELAETFFNSVVTRVLQRTYVHNDFAFVRAAVSTEYIESDPPIYRSYYPDDRGLRPALLEVFADFGWSRPFADLERDVDFLLRALLEHFDGELPAPEPDHQLQVLGSAFYRNKAAYVIGKIVNGDVETAFGVPVLHDADGSLVLDTVLFDDEGISVLFSLSRAYFMVDMDVPSGYIHFLQTLMPSKPRSELYTVGRAREAGQDAVLPRPSPPPAPLAGRLRRGARHARARDARLQPALVPVRAEGDQGRVRALEADRPRDREAEVPDGEADRPRRPHGGHARVQEPRAAARPLRTRAARPAARARAVDDRAWTATT